MRTMTLAGLRAGDALHLAICARQGAVFCTADKMPDEAAIAFGVKTQRVG